MEDAGGSSRAELEERAAAPPQTQLTYASHVDSSNIPARIGWTGTLWRDDPLSERGVPIKQFCVVSRQPDLFRNLSFFQSADAI